MDFLYLAMAHTWHWRQPAIDAIFYTKRIGLISGNDAHMALTPTCHWRDLLQKELVLSLAMALTPTCHWRDLYRNKLSWLYLAMAHTCHWLDLTMVLYVVFYRNNMSLLYLTMVHTWHWRQPVSDVINRNGFAALSSSGIKKDLLLYMTMTHIALALISQ